MSSAFPLFDREQLRILPLEQRTSDLDLSIIKPLVKTRAHVDEMRPIARGLVENRNQGAANILMMGAHVIRSGVQNYLLDLMARGLIDCIAVNGACVIHDYELALMGETCESVARYIRTGEFGFWEETGRLNDIIGEGDRMGLGLGEAVGRAIYRGDFPHKRISILAAAHEFKIPVTVHLGLGADIIHQHPNCDGASLGRASYRDFLIFARVVQDLEGGVVMNFGSAVTAPEVFLKALAMARNLARQKGNHIRDFLTLVCDIVPLASGQQMELEPSRDTPLYFFRPLKTMLIRTVADGGKGFYVRGRHENTIVGLWSAVKEVMEDV